MLRHRHPLQLLREKQNNLRMVDRVLQVWVGVDRVLQVWVRTGCCRCVKFCVGLGTGFTPPSDLCLFVHSAVLLLMPAFCFPQFRRSPNCSRGVGGLQRRGWLEAVLCRGCDMVAGDNRRMQRMTVRPGTIELPAYLLVKLRSKIKGLGNIYGPRSKV